MRRHVHVYVNIKKVHSAPRFVHFNVETKRRSIASNSNPSNPSSFYSKNTYENTSADQMDTGSTPSVLVSWKGTAHCLLFGHRFPFSDLSDQSCACCCVLLRLRIRKSIICLLSLDVTSLPVHSWVCRRLRIIYASLKRMCFNSNSWQSTTLGRMVTVSTETY
jgi:hypothetical protein